MIALTASPEKAVEWGVDETRVLPFSESVGGRYSLWSSIGFPIALAVGWEDFAAMLDGAARVDAHFRDTDGRANLPLRAAFADLYYARHQGRRDARGVRLRRAAAAAAELPPAARDGIERQEGHRGRRAGRRPDRADHLGRRRHRRAARGVPAAPPGHAPGAGRVHRQRGAGRRSSTPRTTASC